MIDSLDSLLERLNSGDSAAAEEAFVACEPYLRKVVRRMLPANLRTKLDSIDVVNSVCGDVMTVFRAGGLRFANAAQLRAFLVKATRNRFVDRYRQNRRALQLERPLDSSLPSQILHDRQPRPSEAAVAEELWDRLLELCPPEHHDALRLRRQGWSTTEIGRELGLHEGSVRRIFRNLSVRLACRQPSSSEAGRT